MGGIVPYNFRLWDRALSLKKRSSVRNYDVTGVLKSLKAAGMPPSEVWVGSVRIVLDQDGGDPTSSSSPARDVQDELAKHFANGRF